MNRSLSTLYVATVARETPTVLWLERERARDHSIPRRVCVLWYQSGYVRFFLLVYVDI
jgi:hypothetical protein